jgi:hypothetical protein
VDTPDESDKPDRLYADVERPKVMQMEWTVWMSWDRGRPTGRMLLEGSGPGDMDGPDGRTDCAHTAGGQPDGLRKDIERVEVNRMGWVGADALEPGTV